MVAVVGFNLDLGKLKEQLSFGGVVCGLLSMVGCSFRSC